ncbi:hypothetical protein MVUOKPPV_CDS0009 [Klebsiella phage phi1_175008]|uniref:Uncharacterized protein n=1 Tax=Klebsiella phage phi1_175008 TaxID=3127744 RepID=A0ACD5FR79_9CAUD
MFNPNEGLTSMLIVLGIVCGVVGWGVIELLCWLFSFVHIAFGR